VSRSYSDSCLFAGTSILAIARGGFIAAPKRARIVTRVPALPFGAF
jgi:hypothetical protein